MSFWRTTLIKKSRKDYPCQLCQLKIAKGTSYYNEVGSNGNDFNAYKLHPECKFYVEKTFENGECFSPFKEPRSEATLYALKYGDEKIKNEVKQNLLKEFPKWKEEDIISF